MLIAGQKPSSSDRIEIRNPYSGKLIDAVPAAGPEHVADALEAAARGAAINRRLPRHRRAAILGGAAELLRQRQEAFARRIVEETGKTIRQARKEVARCIVTLRLSSEEAGRLTGETIPFDSCPDSRKRHGYFVRDPLGVILGITPFNDPLNLLAHKLGPALAGGNAIILKPSERAPLSALALAELMLETGMPPELVTMLIGEAETGAALVAAPEIRMISFTGGARTAEAITRTAGLKKLAMDLGGNAPVIVLDDCHLDSAVGACVSGAFWAAGQNCIGVQRLLVHERIYDRFKSSFVDATAKLVVGDPMSEETDVGPLIDETEARRIEGWVDEAVASGAALLTGHVRDGAVYHPTVLENVPRTAKVRCEEAFAPVVTLQRISELDEAIAEANAPEFSLHAAIFTQDIDHAFRAAEQLQAGGVIVNDSTDYRIDAMPFGGYKRGSLGREGVRFAIEEMTQPKVVCFTLQPDRQ
jgi:acyl-CoA reductase-like NAD-dependent aldehyde dehydrogenase